MIYRFQPFTTDKSKFGEVYNAHCEIVPNDDDWIQIMDYDAMILTPIAYKIIDKAIEVYPDTAIFGAMCNRIAHDFQRPTISINENDSMRGHIAIAEDRAHNFQNGDCANVRTIAGFFMLFRKSYWMEGKFQDHIIGPTGHLFDWQFCQQAIKKEMPMRIIQGVYCWHTYRLTHENYKRKDHLKL